MAGLNKVMIIGHLGRDPEVRYSQNGLAIANFSIATSDSWKDKNSGEKVERTEWHRIVIYDKLAEIAKQYLRKGSQVYVEGRLQTRKWTDQNNVEKYTTEIVCQSMTMLGARQGGSVPYDDDIPPEFPDEAPSAPVRTPPSASRSARPPSSRPASRPAPPPPESEDFDDDVPF